MWHCYCVCLFVCLFADHGSFICVHKTCGIVTVFVCLFAHHGSLFICMHKTCGIVTVFVCLFAHHGSLFIFSLYYAIHFDGGNRQPAISIRLWKPRL